MLGRDTGKSQLIWGDTSAWCSSGDHVSKALKTERDACTSASGLNGITRTRFYLPTWGNQAADQEIPLQQQCSRNWESRNESQWSHKVAENLGWTVGLCCVSMQGCRQGEAGLRLRLEAEEAELRMQGARRRVTREYFEHLHAREFNNSQIPWKTQLPKLAQKKQIIWIFLLKKLKL